MIRSRRDHRQSSADIWPGFVDALSTLLLVIIFLLVVFVLGQFFLNQLLEGKDSKLLSLEQAIAELTDQLGLEQDANAELRRSVAQLTADLQSANADREDSSASLAEIEAERDDYRDRLITLEEDKKLLAETLAQLRQDLSETGNLEDDLVRANQLRAELEAELEAAKKTIEADKETVEARLAELVQLRRDIETLKGVRKDLELDVAEMTTLLREADKAKTEAAAQIERLTALLSAAQEERDRLKGQVAELDQSETERKSLEERIAELNALLSTSQDSQAEQEAEIQKLQAALDDVRAAKERDDGELAERERRIAELAAELEAAKDRPDISEASYEELQRSRAALLAELSQVRDRASQLEGRLASEQDRTLLAQRELEKRAVRLAELLRSVGETTEEASAQRERADDAVNQIELLNRQINELRTQLASLEEALDLERGRVEAQKVTIADLGSKLNVALAGKVEELSRFRSEFFGRLRQILGNRSGIRVVGDRFVFQSEILFPSASADLEPSGADELRALAQSLKEISAEIPSELPWVLQINGHTDRRPISTPEFPSNWELSAARATIVGKFLISQGIPPERIAVAGFAQYQPLDEHNDEIAYRRNRRIEVKLTTR
ncbi:MAG: peptidoglycan -binding protein [Alphaproteobacteria bacterium]